MAVLERFGVEPNGRFAGRDQLHAVPRLGDKAFEQAAGFLRIRDGDNPLDASGVHPEAYGLVRKMLADLDCDIASLVGNSSLLRGIVPAKYADVLKELEKPGRGAQCGAH